MKNRLEKVITKQGYAINCKSKKEDITIGHIYKSVLYVYEIPHNLIAKYQFKKFYNGFGIPFKTVKELVKTENGINLATKKIIEIS